MSKQCECGATEYEQIRESHGLNLYAHTDKWFQCQECGEIITHGIPDDHDAGMQFYNVETDDVYPRPDACCERELMPTKIWPSNDTVQFKCPECYRVVTVEPEGVS